MIILTEKESVAKNYAKALNLTKTQKGLYENAEKTIKLTYAAGHLYTLYDMEDYETELRNWKNIKKLPYIPKTYLTKTCDFKGKAIKEIRLNCEKHLRNAIAQNEEIVIATDPDREGEVIARFILNKLKADYKNVTRIWCCEGINRNEVIKSIKERQKDSEYERLYQKGFNQKKSDWVTGCNLTRLLSLLKNDGTTWSIGRVQTAVMQEIYDRDIEIRLFVKQKYYEIKVTDSKKNEWFLDERYFKKKVTDKKEIIQALQDVQKSIESKVDSVQSNIERKKAPLLYDSSSLCSDSNALFNLDVDKTLSIAQSLYNEKGAISYPRTSSRYLKEEDIEEYEKLYQSFLSKVGLSGKGYSLKNNSKNVFNTKKCEGHHAIIPSKEWKGDGEEDKVYSLILRSFLMAGMNDYECEKKSAIGHIGKYIVYAEGKKVIDEGWRVLDLHKKEEAKDIDVKENDFIKIEKVEIVEKETEPKKHYTQGTLINWMKNPGGKDEEGNKIVGIGTQATQAGIIKTLFLRNYIETRGKHIEITGRGISLIEKVRDIKLLSDITKAETTTKWEMMNEEDSKGFLRQNEEIVKKIFESEEKELKTAVEKKEVGTCPYCGGKITEGKNGWYCSNYKEKDCKNSLSFNIMGLKVDEEFMKIFLERGESEVIDGVKKDGEKCRFKIKVDEEGKFGFVYLDASEEVCKCPKCGNGVFSYAKVYKCGNKECDFFMWKKTSGMEISKEMCRLLCNGERVKTRQTKKDGSEAVVTIHLDDEKDKILIGYEK